MHKAHILAHVFSCLFITILILFLGIARVGSSHPPLPCFWYLDFDSSLSTCIAYKLSCLNWACCAQVFYASENVCRLLLAILYQEFTAVMCYSCSVPDKERIYLLLFCVYFRSDNVGLFSSNS